MTCQPSNPSTALSATRLNSYVACLNWVDEDWSYPRRPCVLPHVRKEKSWISNIYKWLSSI